MLTGDYLDQTFTGKLITACRTHDFHPLERTHGAQTTKRMCLGTSLDNLFYILLTESAVPVHSFPELLKFSLRPFHL